MTDLFRYPASAGARRRDTSRQAVRDVARRAGPLRGKCLAVLERSNGLTADEVAGRLGESVLSVRPRMTELTRLGKIRDLGIRRRNASGRTAIVWVAFQPARLNRSVGPAARAEEAI